MIKKRAFEDDLEKKRAFFVVLRSVVSLVVLLTLFRASSEVFKEKNLFVVAGEWSESEIIL